MREGIAEGAAVFRRRHLKGVVCALVGAGLWGFSGAVSYTHLYLEMTSGFFFA